MFTVLVDCISCGILNVERLNMSNASLWSILVIKSVSYLLAVFNKENTSDDAGGFAIDSFVCFYGVQWNSSTRYAT